MPLLTHSVLFIDSSCIIFYTNQSNIMNPSHNDDNLAFFHFQHIHSNTAKIVTLKKEDNSV